MKKRQYVWIVEIKFYGERIWSPTVGVGLNREDAWVECLQWKKRNPTDEFRIRRYRKVEP